MNKRGAVKRLMFEIAYIVFAAIIGLTVLYFVFSSTKDTSFKAKVYAEDLAQTVDTMQVLSAKNIKINYFLPEDFKFNLDENYVYVNDKDIQIKAKYSKKDNNEIKFSRNKDILILEKNEIKQESLI